MQAVETLAEEVKIMQDGDRYENKSREVFAKQAASLRAELREIEEAEKERLQKVIEEEAAIKKPLGKRKRDHHVMEVIVTQPDSSASHDDVLEDAKAFLAKETKRARRRQ